VIWSRSSRLRRFTSVFRALWRTPEFQESHASRGYVFRWIERLAEYPRFIGELTEPRIERAHFSPWWNVLGRRTYDNPAVHDLFYLHEIAHMAMLVYEGTMSWEAWAAKMADNEMLASLESETLVYLAMPSLPREVVPAGDLGRSVPRGGRGRWHARRRHPRGASQLHADGAVPRASRA
jgi:hypothetical protein